jgi:hypothetical protein
MSMTTAHAFDSAVEKRALKRQNLVTKSKSDAGLVQGSLFEPVINPLNYKIDLVKALNYYNSAYPDSEKRVWVETYIGSANLHNTNKLIDYDFRSVGAIIRLKMRNQYLSDNEITFIETKLSELYSLNTKKSQDAAEPIVYKVVTATAKKEKLETAANAVGADFDWMLSRFASNGTNPDFIGYLNTNKVSSEVAKRIPVFYAQNIADVKAVFDGDEEMAENYGHMTRVQLRKYLGHLESIKSICDTYANGAVSVKQVSRKPRAKKVKPASVLVKNVKYLENSTELGIKSISPAKLVGATEAWLFNVRYRKLTILRVADGNTMTVKGSTILGFDESLSVCKAIRKPEMVKDMASMQKRAFNTAWTSIKTKVQGVTGRVGEDTLIVKVG